ncbi:hypothetical protein SDRG_15286 [Saprolegnia diclina VS20]|uniref:Uncharacterized protein n=1 Tax=Saprolegnia diclina (strain VS20) TaxID=1156394 RepID=T0Q0V2_SAPDV|nr:hypothetical protein SDRG_15286 [Saprolegnia diclina VS20]EQC26955.1 hypothetical protein SDRG_15286 [Saprolegnia diclina VS20]|eukprot:XP_008619676.1 hypothetical protein SDRG_15286 [Saprolegnia diclina VS20]
MVFIFLFSLSNSYINTTAAPYVALYWAKVETLNTALTSILGSLVFASVLAATGKYGTQWNWRYALVLMAVGANVIDAVAVYCPIYDLPLGINFVVGTFVIIELADEGSEGVMYGLLTTIANLPGVFGPLLTVPDAHFDVGRERIALDAPETRNHVAYTYVISYAATGLGCLCVFLLPSQKAAVADLKALVRATLESKH